MAMTISISDAGKRYNREWIFRHFTYSFEQGKAYAITGPNGSGKSTLLQAIGGSLHINEGTLNYQVEKKPIPPEQFYNQVAICAPYLEVVEEMTLREFLHFHFGFKPILPGVTYENIIQSIGLEKAINKQIRYYSSGMKQRVKLAQCIFSNVPVILLDEPCTNLDATGVELYHRLVNDYCRDRLVIVSSNDEVEYRFSTARINISDYKK
jgi:ABC-type multidrug transport system ATPase subunit